MLWPIALKFIPTFLRIYGTGLLLQNAQCHLRRSPIAADLVASPGERDDDRSSKKHRQRSSHSKTEYKAKALTSSQNTRHSAPLPAESSHHSSVNSSLNNLSHSTTCFSVGLLSLSQWTVDVYTNAILTHYYMPFNWQFYSASINQIIFEKNTFLR